MSAPVIPDTIEAACQRPGEWLVEGRTVKRQMARTWIVEGMRGYFPTLQAAIDRIAGDAQ